MKDGFIRVAAATPKLKIADCGYNADQIVEQIKAAADQQVKVCVFPELCITGYTCGDLFLQELLLTESENALAHILEETKDIDMVLVLGMPLMVCNSLYNVAVFAKSGKICMAIPKKNIPNYQEFYEARHFSAGIEEPVAITLAGQRTMFGTRQVMVCDDIPELRIAGEICEDLWVPDSPAMHHAMAGATLICNPSASDELATKAAYRRNLIAIQSGKLVAGYIYADAGKEESTQDLVYAGHDIIAENGAILCESNLFDEGIVTADIDLKRIVAERRRMSTFPNMLGEGQRENAYLYVPFTLELTELSLERPFSKTPFVPADEAKKNKRCEEILTLQAMGLRKRLAHTGCRSAVIGLSGGLDSTLALLATVKAFDLLGLDHRDIVTVTMPGFGTTDRTYQNALKLAEALGTTIREISIVDAVRQHFKDIGQDENVHDITYENGQARERTQILMDLANKNGGLVIGTGDMSEMALGWATYNGDHMSMYAVNVSIPKTLVRYLVRWYADQAGGDVARVLYDVLDTPVSPELLPPKDGEIAQRTEDIVGPYELHDFFLYYMMRFGYAPTKIYRIAKLTFADKYAPETILLWMKTFYRRFFSQQFKRSCVPDGPKVGTVSLSPRGDLRMPSDACGVLWQKELEGLG